jgi:glycosyltransferase involved in cell wall biosynthesis
MNKKISVALCTYNGELFIKEQLDSILNQTVKVDEIVICDDCSKDTTASILEVYKNNYPDIVKVFYNAENLKSNKNFEKLFPYVKENIFFYQTKMIFGNPKR